MTVNGIDPQAAQVAGSSSPIGNALKSVSDLLGMSQDDIRTALKGGSSLSDLAQAKGVSSDQLINAITQSLQAAGAPGSADLQAVAQKIADHKGLPHHRHHHPHPGASPATAAQPVPGSASGTDLYA